MATVLGDEPFTPGGCEVAGGGKEGTGADGRHGTEDKSRAGKKQHKEDSLSS